MSVFVIFGVLLLFLRSFRSAMVVFATIAFSILIALNLIYFTGLSLNIMTLMGLAMGFGLIVDNSIVVLENIYRRWQSGERAEDAIRNGASQVVLPIMAATATTLIVFVPFVYMQDELRVFYVPLAVVVALTLLASLAGRLHLHPGAGQEAPARPGRVGRRRGAGTGTTGARPIDPGETAGRRAPLYERFYRGLVVRTLRWRGSRWRSAWAPWAAPTTSSTNT